MKNEKSWEGWTGEGSEDEVVRRVVNFSRRPLGFKRALLFILWFSKMRRLVPSSVSIEVCHETCTSTCVSALLHRAVLLAIQLVLELPVVLLVLVHLLLALLLLVLVRVRMEQAVVLEAKAR